jgi:hypothetical protein
MADNPLRRKMIPRVSVPLCSKGTASCFFEQVFSGRLCRYPCGRLCLSGATEKTLRLRRRGGASIGSEINGKPEAFPKDSGKAAHPVFWLRLCCSMSLC